MTLVISVLSHVNNVKNNSQIFKLFLIGRETVNIKYNNIHGLLFAFTVFKLKIFEIRSWKKKV